MSDLHPAYFTQRRKPRVTNCIGGWTGPRCRSEEKKKIHCKGKSIPVQAWTGPYGSKRLRLPDFVQSAHEGGKFVSPTHRPPLPPPPPHEIFLILISVRGKHGVLTEKRRTTPRPSIPHLVTIKAKLSRLIYEALVSNEMAIAGGQDLL
jgi:hypothetical protein